METERRARGFERLGIAGARSFGLSASRRRSLEIESAWRRVAGPSIARRVRVTALDRGVLEVRVESADWRRAIERLAPELSARLAREFPSLGIADLRIIDAPPR
ncbi:MAG TPA: DciA family protein [Candidatus Polarisedimenticolaceae bacterium]|nr:DciA family protein [Candidatus Polarisedimenticolaceae bacterium]